jgi:hypothetical protein
MFVLGFLKRKRFFIMKDNIENNYNCYTDNYDNNGYEEKDFGYKENNKKRFSLKFPTPSLFVLLFFFVLFSMGVINVALDYASQQNGAKAEEILEPLRFGVDMDVAKEYAENNGFYTEYKTEMSENNIPEEILRIYTDNTVITIYHAESVDYTRSLFRYYEKDYKSEIMDENIIDGYDMLDYGLFSGYIYDEDVLEHLYIEFYDDILIFGEGDYNEIHEILQNIKYRVLP